MLVPARRSMGTWWSSIHSKDADVGQAERASAFKRDANHGAVRLG